MDGLQTPIRTVGFNGIVDSTLVDDAPMMLGRLVDGPRVLV